MTALLGAALGGRLADLKHPARHVGHLTLPMIVELLVDHRTSVPGACSGALLRRRVRGVWRAHLVFLDEFDEPILDGPGIEGYWSSTVDTFDDELVEMFAGTDLIVFR
ncbi:hypothetical protein [Spirillospora sp. CA-294931]|uniref:hypothetical protein n=1 Tax=Spirillospora sp. CA-294931 TaxID=3240042 RepID=UPI003D92CEAB